jgi:hypothetical protein
METGEQREQAFLGKLLLGRRHGQQCSTQQASSRAGLGRRRVEAGRLGGSRRAVASGLWRLDRHRCPLERAVEQRVGEDGGVCYGSRLGDQRAGGRRRLLLCYGSRAAEREQENGAGAQLPAGRWSRRAVKLWRADDGVCYGWERAERGADGAR